MSPSAGGPALEAGTERDVDAFLALLEEAAAWLWSRGIEQWRPRTMAARRSLYVHAARAGGLLVLRDGPALRAGCLATPRRDPYWEPSRLPARYLHALVVARSAAGRGLGRAVLAGAAARAQDEGAALLRLDCWDGNETLRAYYREAGFRELEAVPTQGFYVRLFEKRLN